MTPTRQPPERPLTEPSERLDRDRLVLATIRLVDQHGVARFTMRMLGEELGRSAMATYRHVANKDELIALAADAVLDEVPIPDTTLGTARERLRILSRNAYAQLAAHPWVAPFLLTIRRATPNTDRLLEALVTIIAEVEPDRERARQGAGAIRAYLIGWLAGAGLSPPPIRPVNWHSPRSGLSASAREHFDFGLDAMIVGILVSIS
ncbi:MAG TPA: TetR/AcrR family transcriptional regulator [Pseudonocardia sp.]